MAITDTSFFNNYQNLTGVAYAQAYGETLNPSKSLQNYIGARQAFVVNQASTEVQNGITVVNAHLSAEATFTNTNLNAVKNSVVAINNFFNSTYSTPLRDVFFGTLKSNNIAWSNAFKDAWYNSNSNELVHQIGFVSSNGTTLVFYPAVSAVTNIQNTASFSSNGSTTLTLVGYGSDVAQFARIGDQIVAYSGTFPNAYNYSNGVGCSVVTVTGYANTNSLIVSSNVLSSANAVSSFRIIKNPEYLEFRYGSSTLTGLAATAILAPISLSVTLGGATTASAVPVTLALDNTTPTTYGRYTIGTYGNTAFKGTSIQSISIVSGSVASLGAIPALEVWVKSTN